MKSRLINQVIKSWSVASIYAHLENDFFIYTNFLQAFLSLNKGDWFFQFTLYGFILVSFARLKGKRLVLYNLYSQLITRDVSQYRREETAVIQALSPFACNFLDGITVLPFFRKHCTLMTTLDMGKIYSNHLHFLSYWLKCSVDNTELQWHFRAPKFLGEACPRRWSPLLWSAFGVPTFFLCVHLQNLKLRPSNLYESRKLASHNSCIRWFLKWAIINLELLWFRCKLGKSWNGAYYFENTCSRKFHSLCVIHNTRISSCKWPCFIQIDCNRFSETDISYTCHKWFE